MALGPDPSAVLNRFLDKQRRQDQFSEDMQKVMYTGAGAPGAVGVRNRSTAGAAGTRARSPGLAAGAALALGGALPASAADCHSEAREQCRQAVDNARRQTCPFDDHVAFGANPSDRAAPVRMPVHELDDVAACTKEARNLGKYNRDIAQKTGAGAPFDAPCNGSYSTSGNAIGALAPAGGVGGRRCGQPLPMPRATPILADAVAGARAEAVAAKERNRGTSDLLGGYEFRPEQQEQRARRNVNLPPRPHEALLPAAMMKLQYDGGSVKKLTCEKTEYLNSKVLAEANRDRNMSGIMFG